MCNKKVLKSNDYKECLLNNEIILKSQQMFKSEAHNMYTKEVNKIALSSNDDKKLQAFDGIHTYPLGTNVIKVCKSGLDYYLIHKKNEIILKSKQRLQTFDKITSYPYGTNAEKVCKTELLNKYK